MPLDDTHIDQGNLFFGKKSATRQSKLKVTVKFLPFILLQGVPYYINNTGQQNLTFFCALTETNKSLLILGRWNRIRYWFFSITSEFCSIASFMVARSINQFFAFCEKTIRDIENLNTYRRFKIKFCAF